MKKKGQKMMGSESSTKKENSFNEEGVLDVLSLLIEEQIQVLGQKVPKKERDKKADTKSNRMALVRAIEKKNIEQVQELLELGMDPNYIIERSKGRLECPLDLALASQESELVKMLLDADARYDRVWDSYIDEYVKMEKESMRYNKNLFDEGAIREIAINELYIMHWLSKDYRKMDDEVLEQLINTVPQPWYEQVYKKGMANGDYLEFHSVLKLLKILKKKIDQFNQLDAQKNKGEGQSDEKVKGALGSANNQAETNNQMPIVLLQVQQMVLEKLLGTKYSMLLDPTEPSTSSLINQRRLIEQQWKECNQEQAHQIIDALEQLEEQKKRLWDSIGSERVKHEESLKWLSNGVPMGLWVEELWKMTLHRDDLTMMKRLCQPHWYQSTGVGDGIKTKGSALEVRMNLSVDYVQGWRIHKMDVPNQYIDLSNQSYGGYNWKNSNRAPVLRVPMLTYALHVGGIKCAKVLSQMKVHKELLEHCTLSAQLLVYGVNPDCLSLLKQIEYPIERLVDQVSGATPLHYWCHSSTNKALLSQVMRVYPQWLTQKNKEGALPYELCIPGERKKVQAVLEEVVLKKQMPLSSTKKASSEKKHRL